MTIENVVKIFNKLFKPWKNRILLIVGRGILLAAKDSKDIQQLQVTLLAGEVKDQVELMGHFGFASNSPKGSDVVMLSVGGNRDHGIIIATESREYRFKDLGEGEAALYSKDGDYIHLKNGNAIDIKTSTLNIEADDTTITGTLTVQGAITAEDEITAEKSVTVTENVLATGDVTGDNVVGVTSAGAPSIAAATSLVVAGTELKDYQTHTHSYEDDNGSGTTNKNTGGVN